MFFEKLFLRLCKVGSLETTGLRWSSGYDARLTRERSPVQTWDGVFSGFVAIFVSMDNEEESQCILLLVARLAQLVERKALNLVVVGSSPTVGILQAFQFLFQKEADKSKLWRL